MPSACSKPADWQPFCGVRHGICSTWDGSASGAGSGWWGFGSAMAPSESMAPEGCPRFHGADEGVYEIDRIEADRRRQRRRKVN